MLNCWLAAFIEMLRNALWISFLYFLVAAQRIVGLFFSPSMLKWLGKLTKWWIWLKVRCLINGIHCTAHHVSSWQQSLIPFAFMLCDSFWIWPEQKLCHLPGTPVSFVKKAVGINSIEIDVKKVKFVFFIMFLHPILSAQLCIVAQMCKLFG